MLTACGRKLLFVQRMINTTMHCFFFRFASGEDEARPLLPPSMELYGGRVVAHEGVARGVCRIPLDGALHGSELPGSTTEHAFEARWRGQERIKLLGRRPRAHHLADLRQRTDHGDGRVGSSHRINT